MNCLEEGYPAAKQSRHSEDDNSLKQFEIGWLLTESSNQLLTETEMKLWYHWQDLPLALWKQVSLQKIMSYKTRFTLLNFYTGDLHNSLEASGRVQITDRSHDLLYIFPVLNFLKYETRIVRTYVKKYFHCWIFKNMKPESNN